MTDLLVYFLPFGFLFFQFLGLGFLYTLSFPLVIALKDCAFCAWAKKRLQSALGVKLNYSWALGKK